MNEFVRKKIVSLKRNTKVIPLIALAIGFVWFSFNLTSMSNTTAKIQGVGMGLSQFAIMLFSLLSLVCMLNAFPHRKPVNKPMLILLYVMLAIVIYADIHYIGRIDYATTGESATLVINDSMSYISWARQMLTVHIVLEVISAVLVALLPVYTAAIRRINTAVKIEDNGDMAKLEITG